MLDPIVASSKGEVKEAGAGNRTPDLLITSERAKTAFLALKGQVQGVVFRRVTLVSQFDRKSAPFRGFCEQFREAGETASKGIGERPRRAAASLRRRGDGFTEGGAHRPSPPCLTLSAKATMIASR